MKIEFSLVAGPYDRPLGGLAWDGKGMLFSDIMESRILRFDPRTRRTALWRDYTNRTNGIAFGPGGVLFGCQEGSRRLVRYEPDGSTTLTTQVMKDGRVHNHPCGLAVETASRVWFSDPYNAMAAWGPQLFGKLDHASVLRLDQDPAPQRRSWSIERVTRDTRNPRGIALSPDHKTLYVCESNPEPDGAREIRAYPILEDGSAGQPRVLHTFGSDYRGSHRGAEGITVDEAGNVLAVAGWRRSGPGPRLYVFDASGALIETHAVPGDSPNSCAFGGPSLSSLYVTTAGGELYCADRVGTKGVAPGR
jgi:gluconolactonase